jgi:hypothetical protein
MEARIAYLLAGCQIVPVLATKPAVISAGKSKRADGAPNLGNGTGTGAAGGGGAPNLGICKKEQLALGSGSGAPNLGNGEGAAAGGGAPNPGS